MPELHTDLDALSEACLDLKAILGSSMKAEGKFLLAEIARQDERIAALEAERDRLKAELLVATKALEDAPHDWINCASHDSSLNTFSPDDPDGDGEPISAPCDCWKSRLNLSAGTAMLEVARAAEKVAGYWQNPVSSTVLDDALDGLVKACAGLKHTT